MILKQESVNSAEAADTAFAAQDIKVVMESFNLDPNFLYGNRPKRDAWRA
jgi:hypothetical protein